VAAWPACAVAQAPERPDTGARDTAQARALAPLTVSVTRLDLPLSGVPAAVGVVVGGDIAAARPTWGLDEALATVPGLYASNRYNFSLDERLSIRGFGARSSFGIRGIRILVDGIPQTLPDGTGQLTNLELGEATRIEVVRGPSSALFGNASGGVISIRTDAPPPSHAVEELSVAAGSFGGDGIPLVGAAAGGTWAKWRSTTRLRLGEGVASLTLSRLAFGGERQHSVAEMRLLNARYATPLGGGLTLAVLADVGDDPRADNPGALTAAELARNPDSAAALNLSQQAGKDVTQYQGGVTLRKALSGGEASLTLFGFSRDLSNPQTYAYIRLARRAYGARASVTHALRPGPLSALVTAGVDVERQRDDRLNVGNQGGVPDTVRQLDQLESVWEVGPFTQGVLQLGPRTTFTAGVRYDWVSFDVRDRLVTATNPDDSGRRLMASASGLLGATYTLGGATLYANLGTSFETPTTTELDNRPDTAGGFNAALGPQRATNLEVGLRGELAGRARLSVAAYRDDVRGELIAYQVPSSPGRVFYQNAGRSRHLGLELAADVVAAPGARLVASWTQSDFRYVQYTSGGKRLDGRRIPGIPAGWGHLLVRLSPRFAGGAWVEAAERFSSSVLVDDTLDTRAAAWWTMDLRLGWDGHVGGAAIGPFVALNNVFARRYVGSVVINATAGRYYEPAPGRNLYAGLSVRMGR